MDIDTRSDIYSLGVLLYELLTGKTPFESKQLAEASLDVVRRTIREKEPPRPSTRLSTLSAADLNTVAARRRIESPKLIHLLRGDLDWIVMKCLEKDRSRRYETANGLAMDLQRHLTSEPVVARPPSAAYRFRKLVHRNKLVFAAGTSVLLVLLFGVLATAWQAVRATTAERVAQHEQQKTQQALEAETRAKGELMQTLEREQHNAYFQRITLAHRELLENNLLKAEELLSECVPRDRQKDYRSWEWYYLKRLCRIEQVTLPGQSGWSRTVAFSPDGQRLASATEQKNMKIWDATTGRELLTLPDTGEVFCAAFRPPDARWVVTGGRNGAVMVWDTTTGQAVRTLGRHAATVTGLAFSPDGRLAVSAGRDNAVKIWNPTTGNMLHDLSGHERWVLTVACSPDGQLLASGGFDTTVRIWELATGKLIRTFRPHHDPVSAVAFSPDGRRLATGSFDGVAKILDLTAGQEILALREHTQGVTGVAFLDGGQRLASASTDKTIKIWNTTTGELVLSLRGHTDDVTALASSLDGRRLASVSQDRTINIWDATPVDAQAGEETLTLRGHTSGIWDLAFSPDGRSLASAGGDATVRVWDAETGREKFAFAKHIRAVFSVAFSPDRRRIASGSAQLDPAEPSCLKVWDATMGQEVLEVPNDSVEAFCLAFSPDNGRWLVTGNLTGSRSGDVVVRDALTAKQMHRLSGHEGGVIYLAFSPEGRRLASLSREGKVLIYDTRRWGEENPPESFVSFRASQTSDRGSLAFSPDGKRLVVPGDDNVVNIWDVPSNGTRETLAPGLTLRGHTAQVWAVAFSPDGQWVASGAEDNTVKLWNATTGGKPLHTFRGHGAVVSRVVFSPDGKRLASASFDKTAKIWNITPSLAAPGR